MYTILVIMKKKIVDFSFILLFLLINILILNSFTFTNAITEASISATDDHGNPIENNGTSKSSSITFSILGSAPGGPYKLCSLDGQPFIHCTVEYTLNNLNQGKHNLLVNVFSKTTGQPSETSTFSWTINGSNNSNPCPSGQVISSTGFCVTPQTTTTPPFNPCPSGQVISSTGFCVTPQTTTTTPGQCSQGMIWTLQGCVVGYIQCPENSHADITKVGEQVCAEDYNLSDDQFCTELGHHISTNQNGQTICVRDDISGYDESDIGPDEIIQENEEGLVP